MADKAPKPLPCFLSKQAVALRSCVIPQSFRTPMTFSSLREIWAVLAPQGLTSREGGISVRLIFGEKNEMQFS